MRSSHHFTIPRTLRRLISPAAILLTLAFPGIRNTAALCDDAGDGGPRAGFARPRPARTLVLSFDAAWSDDGAIEILDTLRERGIHATFFLAGRFVMGHPDIVRRIAAEGHEAGNHTFRHDHMIQRTGDGPRGTRSGLTFSELKDEMDRTATAYEATTGRVLVPLWRAPYGETNGEILAWGRRAGYTHVGWSEGLDALDWVSDPASSLFQTPEAAVARLLRRLAARSGAGGPAVVLMHLGSTRPEGARFADALPQLIEGASRLGYRFETAGEALGEGSLP